MAHEDAPRSTRQGGLLRYGTMAMLLSASYSGTEVAPLFVEVSAYLLGAQTILVAGTLWDRRKRHALLAQGLREEPTTQ